MLSHFPSFAGRRRTHVRSGWTLVELMISMAVAIVVLGAVLVTSIYVSKSFVIIGNYHDLDQDSRYTLDILSRDIRSISNIVVCTSSSSSCQLKMVDMGGNLIDYNWDSGSGSFTRSYNGTAQVMLKDCDFLSMSNYQRNASANFSFVPTTNLAQIKLIDVRWHCWRPVLGSHLTTESVQTAKIVARNF